MAEKREELQYETELKTNKFLVVVAGDARDIERARDVLKSHTSFGHHAGSSEATAVPA